MSNDLPQKPFKGEVKAVFRWRSAVLRKFNQLGTLFHPIIRRIPKRVRLILLLLIIAGVGFLGYKLYHNYHINSQKERMKQYHQQIKDIEKQGPPNQNQNKLPGTG